MDRTLNSNDSTDILRKLLGLEHKAQNLGRVLNLPKYIIDVTPQPNPVRHAATLYIIEELLKQVEPRPTWRVILAALRDPLVGEAGLARDIETFLMEGSAVSTLPMARLRFTAAHQSVMATPVSTLPMARLRFTAAHQSVMATPPSSAEYTSHQGTGIYVTYSL